jgi:hypothetical protein
MPTWLTSLFLHPEFVIPGAALLSVPIIIHLINRLRYRRVRFAAMEFLLASEQRNRRRLLLEQLLLLLLRLLAVAAMVALIARPLLDPDQFSLFAGQKTHHVVLLDDSGSMQDRWGETTAFASGLDVIRKIAAEGERHPDMQTLTLMLLSNPSQPVVTRENLNREFTARLESTLKSLRPSHRALDAAAGIEAVRAFCEELKGAARNLHFISDFRQRDWDEEPAVAAALQQIEQDKIAVNLVRAVPESHANLGVTALSGAVDVAAVSVPLRLKVTVKNYADEVARDIRLTVLVDGKKLPTVERIDKLDGGREISREIDVVFPTTGPHDVQVSLAADSLLPDNERHLALTIPESNPILIIDGVFGSGGAAYLADALAPAPGITGFSPTIEPVDALRRRPIDRFQSIFLLNVAELPADSLKLLEGYVASGGGLVWFVGDQVRAGFYNESLYANGAGLFPLKIAAPTELFVDETNPASDINFDAHPLFRVFEGDENSFVNLMKVSRYFDTPREASLANGARVIATLRNKAPLFIEHNYGKGRVVTCLTSCGSTWNNWPRIPPGFVSLQLELAKYVARGERQLDQRTVGEPIRFALDASTYSPRVEIRPPGTARIGMTLGLGPGNGATEAPPGGASSNPRFEDEFRDTDAPGIYSVLLKRSDNSDEIRRYAYNVSESESALQVGPTELLRRRLGPESHAQIQEFGEFGWIHGEETTREIHDFVLVVLLVVLLFEQMLALRLSFHPKPVKA